ncbi:MAG: hypothetical protein Alpg2KO_23810 [Alphaproteobacteria bacterium]
MRKNNFILALLMVFGMAFITAPATAEQTEAPAAAEAVVEDAPAAETAAEDAAADATEEAATEQTSGFTLENLPIVGVPEDGGMGFQPPVTEAKEQIHEFHNFLMVVITLITIFVTVLLAYVILKFSEKANPTPAKFTHHNMLEVAWTLIPAAIVVVIMIKSMGVLTTTETVPEDAEMTLKINGFQWAWAYEYPDQQIEEFESYMIRDADGTPAGNPRLLEVDSYAVIPVDTTIRLIFTARDVLHSATVQAF